MVVCYECGHDLTRPSFSSNQLKKVNVTGHQTCRDCMADSVHNAEAAYYNPESFSCSKCDRVFSEVDYYSAADAETARDSHQRDAHKEVLKFFHGTSWKNARQIDRNGFIESENGCLGRGVYVGETTFYIYYCRRHLIALNLLTHSLTP
jgi:hypothetical protein